MTTTTDANALVRGLIFAVQKSRSDLAEGVGTDTVGKAILEDLQPLLFGDKAILPQLLKWQECCQSSGIIAGSDLFNLTKFIDMSEARITLGLLPLYGYPSIPLEGPPLAWLTQSWPYLSDGF